MLTIKNVKVADYSQSFLKKAITYYVNNLEKNRTRVGKYYSTEEGKEKTKMRAKIYYWTKKKQKYHPIYNPNGSKD